MGVLERWKLTAEELDEIVSANASLRGFMFGYVSEYKLRKLWFLDERISHLMKYDNHDRSRTFRGLGFPNIPRSSENICLRPSWR